MISRRLFLTGAAATAAALTTPLWTPAGSAGAAPETCELALENTSLPGQVNAYVTGHAFPGGEWTMLRADGSVYHPEEPPAAGTPLPVDCAIPLPAAGAGPVVLTLPRLFGARVYFVRDDELEFLVNPGPAIVEPAFATSTDPNYDKVWSFCEFTFNDTQLYANISYVDLVTSLPIGLKLEGDTSKTVAPLPDGAVQGIADDLAAQAQKDGQPWDSLVLRGGNGEILRAVSPQTVMAPYMDRPDEMPFRDAWGSYVDQVWDKYSSEDLSIDLQGGRGVLTGRVGGDGVLTFEGGHTFVKPNAGDIFTCDHGPFTNNPSDDDAKKALLARLAAGFNRSTLLTHPDQPNGAGADDYYKDAVTNHWSRIVHANSPIGYAFPYDDVRPDGEPDVSGAANDGNPRRFTVSVGS
ncbi:glycoside hydrolase family 64 protein [Streptomyces sp. NPDC049954]|uniref:glycoside hydrolase family 64 protein n=1 Tax=Streptomyces sp. NPDC049954 TaxID=3155779 RepID=UPI00341F358A